MEWIDIEDRLPKIEEPVLVSCGEEVSPAMLGNINDPEKPPKYEWLDWNFDLLKGWDPITHWMPLPKSPPQEREL